MAAPVTKLSTCATEKLRSRNSRGGITGSGARRSTRTKAASATAETRASPRICGEDQAYVVPAQPASSVRARIAPVSSPAPARSIRALTRAARSRTPKPIRASATAPTGTFT